MKKILLLFLCTLLTYTTYAQATCAGALTLTPGVQQCGDSAGQPGDFPADGSAPANPCNANYNDDEYWFEYTAITEGESLDLTMSSITEQWSGIFVLDDCPVAGPTCVSGAINEDATTDLTFNTGALSSGTSYKIVISNWGTPDNTAFCLDAVVQPPLAPPAEDNCMGAINIPVVVGDCVGLTTGDNTGATDSNGDVPAPPAATCTGYNGGDIWFSLTVPASGNVTISGGPSPGCCSFLWYELYSGTSCSNLTSFMCSSTSGNDPSAFETILSGQTPGATIWIRAWDSNNDNGPGEFNFCAKEITPAANDECNTATMLTESADANCGNEIPSSTLNSSTSANNDCSLSPDVWFELQAVSTSITVNVDNLMAAGSSGLVPVNTVLMVYESCSGANIACAFSPVTFAATPGSTYYIAASTRDVNNVNAPATFDICAYPTPSAPGNDECADATSITPSNSVACENKIPGTTYFSTFSSENICAGGGNDVWYSFVATTDMIGVLVDNLQPTPAGGVPANAVVGVFSGSCGTFTQLACVFDQTEIAVTLGETYYISVTCRDAGNFPVFADFDVCVYNLPPVNDACATATVLAMNTTGSLINQFFGGATPSGLGEEACDVAGASTPADVWFTINTDADGGNLIVIVEPGPQSDVVVAIYDACGATVPEQCVDLGGNGGVETINFQALFKDKKGNESSTRDADYFVRVYEKIPSGQTFEIGAQGEALPIELGSFEAKAEKRGNLVQWSTLLEINSDYIEVQSSPNGSTKWEPIGQVKTQGESTSRIDYELFDYNPYEVTYYRLNAVDKDGKAEFSRTINVRRSNVLGKMTLAPNPAKESIAVQTTSKTEEVATLSVIDMTGKLMKKTSVGLINGLNTINIDLNDLQAGLYLISLQTENGLQVEKFVKQ